MAWRDTYVSSYAHALAAFGADLHADKVKLTMLSVVKNSAPHRMALNNHSAFSNNVKTVRAAKKKAAENTAAATLATLPSPNT